VTSSSRQKSRRRGLASPVASLLAGLALVACGGGVQTADRGAALPANDPVLVQVIEGSPDGPVRLVSVSIWEIHPRDPLPERLGASALETMRAAAAARGATRLYLEREDTPYRRAFFGLGVTPPTTAGEGIGSGPCAHEGFEQGMARARRDTLRCLERLRAERPALQGEVGVVFRVDPYGRVMRAAATPISSRDQQVRACAIGAVHEARFGEPPALVCEGRLEVTFPEGSADDATRDGGAAP